MLKVLRDKIKEYLIKYSFDVLHFELEPGRVAIAEQIVKMIDCEQIAHDIADIATQYHISYMADSINAMEENAELKAKLNKDRIIKVLKKHSVDISLTDINTLYLNDDSPIFNLEQIADEIIGYNQLDEDDGEI